MKISYPLIFLFFLISLSIEAQDYFLQNFGPYDPDVPTPEEFLGYGIGDYHTRHDRIVAYLEALDEASDRAELIDYGKTHELRRLVILQISQPAQVKDIEEIRRRHVTQLDPAFESAQDASSELPVFVNLGYNVHGNEPSSSEAALLTSYVLVASQHPDIERYRQNAIIFVDPTINPDGRDRHTQWANSYRADVLSKDPIDDEHNEMWPRGRTNHYWFDLNRDWLLAVHPESQGKLSWYHQWYPNVVTDFHEMGSNSSYFFEPMKDNGSENPIMPAENYTTLNDAFAKYYQREMDKLGSLYFTKEVFDGTYPGYGSSYPDLQGGLGILFEQASSRGHAQKTSMGEITFPFTIRNQFVNSLATVEAAVDNKTLLRSYQRDFFKSALSNANNDINKAYVIGESEDKGRLKAFLELLLRHKIKVYKSNTPQQINGTIYKKEDAYIIPTYQPQYRMVQTMFETYDEYRDSVFYDASAWSLANAYNINYSGITTSVNLESEINPTEIVKANHAVSQSTYAYIIPWTDYYASSLLYELQSEGIKCMAAQKEFRITTDQGEQNFSYGSIVIPVQHQKIASVELHELLQSGANDWGIPIYAAATGFSSGGIDLGSGYVDALEMPKPLMLIGDGTSSYEAGFVWHLLDQRVKMPITKVRNSMFGRVDLSEYSTLILVSGNYSNLDSTDVGKIKDWVSSGNTLITLGRASEWAIRKKLVKEKLVEKPKAEKDEKEEQSVERLPYVGAREHRGKDAVGGTIFMTEIDVTHPVAYGYTRSQLPVYRNNSVWIEPSKNEFSNVALYTEDPHIDGFITDKILNDFLKKSASVVISRIGGGRAVLFAEDPNFRGTWLGTNKLFLNALFFGDLIRVP